MPLVPSRPSILTRPASSEASFTNGQTRTIGQVALANFTNQQGLQSVGGNRWQESYASGPVSFNAPGVGNA
ncbi:hypothetical protein [Paludibacterium denitrificans]|uniref:hypothetical protein n=1 Tax=Paludibacterium denitrificans TaxID=2675226 RepID=UPI001E52F7F3|nr:hypothetical protein [Paludibacterium denitrificans]